MSDRNISVAGLGGYIFFNISRKRIYSCMTTWLYISTLAARGLYSPPQIFQAWLLNWASDRQWGHALGKKCKLSGTPPDQNLRWDISRSFVRTVSLRSIVLVMGTNIFLSCRIRMKKFENSEDLAIFSNSISWLQISLFFIKELQLKN